LSNKKGQMLKRFHKKCLKDVSCHAYILSPFHVLGHRRVRPLARDLGLLILHKWKISQKTEKEHIVLKLIFLDNGKIISTPALVLCSKIHRIIVSSFMIKNMLLLSTNFSCSLKILDFRTTSPSYLSIL
jgi:hypothetical protein